MWNEITYPFPNFNGAAVEVWECISNFIPYFTRHACDYLSMLGLKLNHVCKRGTWCGRHYNYLCVKISMLLVIPGSDEISDTEVFPYSFFVI